MNSRTLRELWERGVSYCQLHSLRSLACGYECLVLRADYAVCGGYVARSARYGRRCILPQVARRSGRLPAVKHDSALRAVSLRDYVPSFGRILRRHVCGAIRHLKVIFAGVACMRWRDAAATPCQIENSCQRPFYIGTTPSPKLKKLTNGVN